ncbi:MULTISPECIES: hypothetical protein [unclassified Allomuricauda]|uniref:hypothetical protein n=1 Tax=unclassified Allomuricauda TaxID=2615049 RepID=UPI00273F59B2|nr:MULTISPECIES: hypothetical protein [unclassified Allomuricauda]
MKMNNGVGPVKRVDLNLRTLFPELATTIYKIELNKYLIYVTNFSGDFKVLTERFENEIRPLLTPVKLVNTKPEHFQEIIPGLSDLEISKGFQGMLMNKVEWIFLLAAKFPKINFYKISDDDGVVGIHIANYKIKSGKETKYVYADIFSIAELEAFLSSHQSPITFNIIIDEFEEKPELTQGFDERGGTFTYVREKNQKPLFVQRDESLWFDNIDAIFESKYTKEHLYFYDKEEYSCYADFSAFPNIDLRYFLMLYQTMYLSPPLDTKISEWLKGFDVTVRELLTLIERGRVKLILINDTSRYDLGFLNEVYELRPNAIISKRGVSCLQQCDIVEMSNRYIFNEMKLVQELKLISEFLAKELKKDTKMLYNALVWPIKARRKSFEVLHRGGVLSASLYGVDQIIDNPPSSDISEDTSFLLKMFSYATHLSHSLNATYFPVRGEEGYTDESYAEVMGKLLNFYRNATISNLKDFTDCESFLANGNTFVLPIELIKINPYPSILEFEEVLSKEIVFPNSERLIKTLSHLSLDEQKKKIAFYNREVTRYLGKTQKTERLLDLGVQTLFEIIGSPMGLPIGSIFNFSQWATNKYMKKISPAQRIQEKIDLALNQSTDRKNIHFLSKINRVAMLREA